MTYSYDAATLVAKLLEVDEWSEFSFCNGDDTTLSEVLRIAEEICGEKFQVKYLKAEDVKNNLAIYEKKSVSTPEEYGRNVDMLRAR
ncbi:hypothetical protein LTR66_017240, partial [Elasticomyces elasticus]